MKQKNFWRKLLSLGLAAAMMIASLTGPGAVTNPVEVKAEETALAGKIESVGLEFTYAAMKENDTYELSEGPLNTTLQEITVNVTTGGPVKISSPNLSSGVVMQERFTIEFRKDGELVSYGAFGPGEYTVTASYETDDIQPYEGKFTITKATSSTGDQEFGELNITGIMKSGETIKAELTSPPEGVSYTFYRVKGTEETQLETKDNTYTLTDADVGATIKVTVAASGYKEKSVTSGVVESANNGSVADTKPAAPTFNPVTGTSFDSSLSVEITTTTADAAIYYTLDGKDPTAESAKYEAPFTINATTTVKAVAIKNEQSSDVATATYTKSTNGSNNSGSGSGSGSTDGSSTTTPTTPSTGTTASTETKPDGTKVETTTETKTDGTKVETVTETKKDGSATTTVTETEKNASGKEVAVTTVTEKDASGKVQSETKTSVIAKADANTSATVTAVKDSKGAVTVTAEVTKTGTIDGSGKTNGAISAAIVKQITEAAGTSDVTITQTVTNGSKKFTVEVNAKNLISGSNLKIMKLDPKTGEYVLCNKKNYAVNAAGDVDLSIKTDGEFILVNEADAKAASDAVLKTVKVKSSSKTVTKGKSTTVAMSSGLNMKNVSKITYTVSNKSVATVSKNGKVTTKKAGTVTVKAKVTLKNGKTKTVTMKIKVK